MSRAPSWLPSLNALRAFEAVARLASFQKAANELHVSSPAVQQLVRNLEEAVKQPLILRRGRSIVVSEPGTVAAEYLRDGFERIAQGVARMRSQTSSRQLRVSVEPSFASAWLIGRLANFRSHNPAIDVLMDTSERLVDLTADEADLAIRYGKTPPNGLMWRELFADETIAVCSPTIPRRPLKIADLGLQTLIHFERATTMQPNWRTWLEELGVEPFTVERNLRYTDYNMMLQSTIAGHGIALVSKPLVQGAIDAGILVVLFERSVKLGFSYNIVATSDKVKRPDASAFMRWVEDEARTSPTTVKFE